MPGFGAVGELPVAAQRRDLEGFAVVASTMDVLDADVFRLTAATREFITRATDSPANTPFLGTLARTVRLDQSIIGQRGFGELSQAWGEIELINAEADYDQVVLNSGVDGRRVVVRLGEVVGRTVVPYASFFPIAELTASGWHASRDTLRIRLRDNSYRLEVPAQPNVYRGDGGLEGTDDLKGKRKPRTFGKVLNVTPAPVIPTELVYQVNDGPLQAISAVYDLGAALTPTADHSGAQALRDAVLAPGEFATCLGQGLLRLGGSADGEVTCDVEGDSLGGYVSTTAAIVKRIATTAAGYVDPDDFEPASFALLDVQQPATVGIHLGHESDETAASVIARLMGGIGAWAEHTRLDQMAVRRFTAPGIAPTAYYEEHDLADIDREPLPAGLDPPPRRWRVPYARNWTQQTQLAGAVLADVDRVTYLASLYRLASTTDVESEAVLRDHPLAPDPEPLEAYFAEAADAQAEADRLYALYTPTRSAYRIKLKDRLFAHRLGDTIHVTYRRWDLAGGRYLRIVALVEDMDMFETEIVAFG